MAGMLGKLGLGGASKDAPLEDDELMVDDEEESSEPDDAQLAAAEEFLAAVKSGNAAETLRTFKGLKAACEDY